MGIEIRQTEERDHRRTEEITRDAFWDLYQPGCDEHLILHRIRESNVNVVELDIVATEWDDVLGYTVTTLAKVVGEDKIEHEVLCLGPIGVAPEHQKRGIGGMLIKETIRIAGELGYAGIFLMGNPNFYPRFGFRNAKEFGVTMQDGSSGDFFMGIELGEGRLDGISGRFVQDDLFWVKEDDLADFDKSFPPREKHVRDGQLR